MSYEKQTWATGDTITANKLNHMEDGIESGNTSVMCVTFSETDTPSQYTADKTLEELVQHIDSGGAVFARIVYPNESYSIATLTDYSSNVDDKYVYFTYSKFGAYSSGSMEFYRMNIEYGHSIYVDIFDGYLSLYS